MSLAVTLIGYTVAAALLPQALLWIALQRLLGEGRRFDRLVRALARACILALGIRLRVDPAVRAHRAPVLFVANHVSILDPLILFIALPQPVRGVELEDHFRWPVWGAITRGMGNIPISHRNTASAIESLRRAADVLRSGTSVVILPEGHRTRDGRLGVFMRGPFRLARETRTDIVPLAFRGLYERKNVHSPRFRPGEVEVVSGERIAWSAVARMSDRELSRMVRDRVHALTS